MRLFQPHRVVRLEAHVDELRSWQQPPAVAFARQRDRPLLGVGPAHVMVAEVGELAVAVVFSRERHPVDSPVQHAVVFHQHRGVPRPGMGVPGQSGRPLHHLLGHVTVVPLQRMPRGPLP